MIHYKIILPTFSEYLPVTSNFLDLLKINWPEAINNVIVSVIGDTDDWHNKYNVTILKNKKTCTLPGCLKKAADNYEADVYLSFLGDAFITKAVTKKCIDNFLKKMIDDKIDYCRLTPQFTFNNIFYFKEVYKKISNKERYGHSFVAFACTARFINREFSSSLTDRDFEIKYLKLASKKKYIYSGRAILIKNIFHIKPCIQKGKWDLIRILRLKKVYPNIEFVELDTLNYREQLFITFRKLLLPFLPNVILVKMKSKVKNKSKCFDTKC